jgi:hypothetical protein
VTADALDAVVGTVLAGFEAAQDRALVVTTFGLDEAVLAGLLGHHDVPHRARIVVFHDVMKLRHPGFLRHHYPNSLVIAVQLPDAGKRCPVFHAKLWMCVSRRPFLCRTLGVHSVNLTRFHLDRRSATFESAMVAKNVAVPLPELVTLARVFGVQKGHVRQSADAMTVHVRAERREVLLNTSPKPAHVVVEAAARRRRAIACAGPFVKAKALDLLGGADIPAYTGRRMGVDLHAKLIELPDVVIGGSMNLTAQALGIGSDRAVNTETVVTLRRPQDFSLARLLHGFPRARKDALTGDGPPGDIDPGEDEPHWLEARQLAIAGPAHVCLVLVNGKAGVELRGPLGATTRVEVRSSTGMRESKVARRLFGGVRDQGELARLLCGDEIEVVGFARKDRVWRRQLDLGDLWSWFEHNGRRVLNGDGDGDGKNTGSAVKGKRPVTWEDVRILRRRAYASRRLTAETRRWDDWWARYGGNRARGMPEWCIRLGDELRALRGQRD